MDFVIVELALVGAAVRKVQLAASMLLSVHVRAFVRSSVGPLLFSEALLLVLNPFPIVKCSICMVVNTFTMSFVV